MSRCLITTFLVSILFLFTGDPFAAGNKLSKSEGKGVAEIIEYLVKPGDTLSQIAERLLGSPKKNAIHSSGK